MAATMVVRPSPEQQRLHAQQQLDAAVIRAGLQNAYPFLTKAQRALERVEQAAGKYAASPDEAAREAAEKVLSVTAHVDQALAALRALEGE